MIEAVTQNQQSSRHISAFLDPCLDYIISLDFTIRISRLKPVSVAMHSGSGLSSNWSENTTISFFRDDANTFIS